jgi:Phage integrase, N-terminal SAM-like domain
MASASASRPDLAALNASFRRTLRAQNKSDRTVEAYTDAVRLLGEFCAANGHPLTVSALTREHVELFIADQLAR